MLTYPMNQRDDKSKYFYLYTMIKEDILSGVIRQNEKLPSKRTLAEHLGVSLITVETAYQMLKEEGYTNLIMRSHSELDLTRQKEVEDFFKQEKPEYVFVGLHVNVGAFSITNKSLIVSFIQFLIISE